MQNNTEQEEIIHHLQLTVNATNERVCLLELQVANLTRELQEEQSRSSNFTAVLSELTRELDVARANATSYLDKLALLKKEIHSYESQLSENKSQINELRETLTLTAEKEKSSVKSHSKLTGKDKQIAQLNKQIEQKSEVVETAKKAVEEVRLLFKKMTVKYDSEKERSNVLDSELQKIKQTASNHTKSSDEMAAEITRLSKLLEETSKTANHFESISSSYESKVQFMTRQLLLSKRIVNDKLSEIARFKQELANAKSLLAAMESSIVDSVEKYDISNESNLESRLIKARANEKILLKNEILKEQERVITSLNAEIQDLKHEIELDQLSRQNESKLEDDAETTAENDAIIADLQMQVEDLTSASRQLKAIANEKIIVSNQSLKEKEAAIAELQATIDNLISETGNPKQEESNGEDSLKHEISALKAALSELQSTSKDAQLKAKEKLRLKNQMLKEKEDAITKLKEDIDDLLMEKENIIERWKGEIQRNDSIHQSHEMQLQAVEDRLTKEHIAEISKVEEEMNETVYQLEMEIQSLKKNIGNRESTILHTTEEEGPGDGQQSRLLQLEDAIQEGKKKEISLLNQNLTLKKIVQDLKDSQKRTAMASSNIADERSGNDKGSSTATNIELPSYYKEKQKSRIRRVAGKIWGRLFRRKRL